MKWLMILLMGVFIMNIVSAENFGYTIYDAPTAATNYSGVNVNNSEYWDDMNTINTTQMEDNAGVLNILETWLTTFVDTWFSGQTTDDLSEGTTNLYDNESWNETYADGLYSVGNASWNETYADTLYSDIVWSYNFTTISNLLYSPIKWAYNQTSILVNDYGKYWYNQSSPYDTFNYNMTIDGSGGTDVKSNWNYIIGDNTPSNFTYITFDTPFSTVPDVVASCLGYKQSTVPNARNDSTVNFNYSCSAQGVSEDGFYLGVVDTQGNNIIKEGYWSMEDSIGHFKLNDNLANTIVDDYGATSNNGVASGNTNTLYTASGKINGAFDLVAVTPEYVNIDAVQTDMHTATTGTFALWVNPDSIATDNTAIIGFGDANAVAYIALQQSPTDGRLRGGMGIGTTRWVIDTNSAVLANGDWTHIMLVHNGTEPSLYANGELIASTISVTTDKTAWFNDASGLDNGRIGVLNYNSLGNVVPFDGQVDDVRFFNRVLTPIEIGYIYNSGSGTEVNTGITGETTYVLASWIAKEGGSD